MVLPKLINHETSVILFTAVFSFALAQIYSNNHHLSKKTSPANGLTKITPPARLPCLQKEGLILLIILFQRYCTPRPEIVNSLKKRIMADANEAKESFAAYFRQAGQDLRQRRRNEIG